MRAVDAVNSATLFAATLLMSLFPVFIALAGFTNRNFADHLAERLGLDRRASADVQHLFGTSTTASKAMDVLGWLILPAGALGVAGCLETIYERAFGLERRGKRSVARHLGWVAAFVVYAGLLSTFGRELRGATIVAPPLMGVVSLITDTLFYWWTMRFLLDRRMSWRSLFPSALATAACWLILGVGSMFLLSDEVQTGSHDYGPIGIFFVLLLWLVGAGLATIIGAVTGVVWRERHAPATPRRAGGSGE